MNRLSAQARARRDRILYWQSPTVDDLKSIRALEEMGSHMLESILAHCPDNHERDEALDCLEVLLMWTRKSIIRGHGIDH